MEPIEAFGILRLAPSAGVDEIRQAFRTLSTTEHPDVGGTDAGMQRLAIARDVAIAWAEATRLPAVSPGLLRPASLATRDEGPQTYEARIARHHVPRLKAARRIAGFLALVSLAATLAGSRLEAFGVRALDIPALFWIGLILTVLLAAAALLLSTASMTLRQTVEDLAEELRDQSAFYELHAEIFPGAQDGFTREELRLRTGWWIRGYPEPSGNALLRTARHTAASAMTIAIFPVVGSPSVKSLARRIGAADFSKLFLEVGLARGFLTARVETAGGLPLVKHRLVRPTSSDA